MSTRGGEDDSANEAWGVRPSRQQPARPPRVEPVIPERALEKPASRPERPAIEGRAFRDSEHEPLDLAGTAAVIVGLLGLLVVASAAVLFGERDVLLAGLAAALLAAILSAEAGRRARLAERSQRLALWGFGLAVLDAALWVIQIAPTSPPHP